MQLSQVSQIIRLSLLARSTASAIAIIIISIESHWPYCLCEGVGGVGVGERERGHGLFREGTGKNNLPSSHPCPVESIGSVEEKKLFTSLPLSLGHFLWD